MMAKYHPTTNRNAPPAVKGSKLSQFLWILGAYIAGYFSSGMIDPVGMKRWFQVTVIEGLYQKNAPKILTEAPPPPPKPKLEFYTLLTKGDEELAVASGAPSSSAAASSSSPTPSTKPELKSVSNPTLASAPDSVEKAVYTLQLAALNNRDDAEKMKAQLAIKGIIVQIARIEKDHQPWFRIYVGPYSTRAEVEQVQQNILKSQRISGMIRKASA
jgi:cell division protein FtsN